MSIKRDRKCKLVKEREDFAFKGNLQFTHLYDNLHCLNPAVIINSITVSMILV